MPRKSTQGSGWFAYLEQQGLLGADETAIANARKQYHTLWKQQWRKQQKDNGVCYFKPRFSKSEAKLLRKAATAHVLSPTKFIQFITLSYLDNAPVLPNMETLRKIMQLLGIIHEHLAQLEATGLSVDDRDTLKLRLTVLEDLMLRTYHNPPALLEHIEHTLKRSPDLLPVIRQLLQ